MSGTIRATVLAGVALAALAACAANPKRPAPAEERAQFRQYAGPPIASFTYLGHYNGWRALGEGQVVLWTDINDAYLITVQLPCVDLEFESMLRLSSAQHMVTSGIDSVLVHRQACRVTEIRHVDYLKMKQELHTIP